MNCSIIERLLSTSFGVRDTISKGYSSEGEEKREVEVTKQEVGIKGAVYLG